MTDSNQTRLSRASRGDEGAMEELVARWLPDVTRLVRRSAPRGMLHGESHADLAQSVCREALRRIRGGHVAYQGDREFRAWLLGAVRLKLSDRWRRSLTLRREGERSPVVDVAAHPPEGGGPTPSAQAMDGERAERIAALLGRLDERSAQVVRMIQLEGRSHAEVASELAIEVSHCRTILARALAKLATMARREDL